MEESCKIFHHVALRIRTGHVIILADHNMPVKCGWTSRKLNETSLV